MSRAIERESFGYCDETCPAVEGAFADTWDDLKSLVASVNHDEASALMDALLESVKKVGTVKLRAALNTCVGENQDLDRDLSESQREAKALEEELDDLKGQISALEAELQEAAA